jgi:hypothetical protein
LPLSDQSPPDLPLPSGWTQNVKSAVLHVISLAQFALSYTRGWAADALNPRARQAAAMDRLTNEVVRAHARRRPGPGEQGQEMGAGWRGRRLAHVPGIGTGAGQEQELQFSGPSG